MRMKLCLRKGRRRGRKTKRAKLVYCCALNNRNEETEEMWLRQLSPPAEADVIPRLGFVFTKLFLYPEFPFYSPRPPIAAGQADAHLESRSRDSATSPRVFISCKLCE